MKMMYNIKLTIEQYFFYQLYTYYLNILLLYKDNPTSYATSYEAPMAFGRLNWRLDFYPCILL